MPARVGLGESHFDKQSNMIWDPRNESQLDTPAHMIWDVDMPARPVLDLADESFRYASSHDMRSQKRESVR